MIAASELILNADGSIYHLNILPSDLAETIIFVGDPERVPKVSALFDHIRVKKQRREFHTHTGYYKDKEISVISTGIGTDNIDIVLNELDALVNIDFETRTIREQKKSLRILRIGTSGSIQSEIDIDTFLISAYGIGMDSLLNFYEVHPSENEDKIQQLFADHLTKMKADFVRPYVNAADQSLVNMFPEMKLGITLTHNGFYGPQGRTLRLPTKITDYIDQIASFRSEYGPITNFEMETAGIYGLAKLLDHKALSINLIMANRPQGKFSNRYEERMASLIKLVLDRI